VDCRAERPPPPPQLTPTFRSVNNKFSVKYFLNLVLVDEEDRRWHAVHS